MAYGEPIEDINTDFNTTQPYIKTAVAAYSKGDTYPNVLAKGAVVVETETDNYDNGDDYDTVNAKSPTVGTSTDAYKGLVEEVPEPTRGEDAEINEVTIPEREGVVYVDADTYDPEPEEGDPVIDVLTGVIVLDDTLVTEVNILAVADEGYWIAEDATVNWSFEYDAGE